MAHAEHVRVATLHDKSALESLQMRASLMWEEDREQLIAHPEVIFIPIEQFESGSVLLTEIGSSIVGFTALAMREDGQAELDGLFVEPSLWRRGIASRLMGPTEALARSRGCRELHVIANSRAKGFYEHHGFKVVGRTQTLWRPADLMCKQIESVTR